MDELNEKEQDKLNFLLLEFGNARGIKFPEEPDFIDDSRYYALLKEIEDFLESYEEKGV